MSSAHLHVQMLSDVSYDDGPTGAVPSTGSPLGSITESTKLASTSSGRRVAGTASVVLMAAVGWSILSGQTSTEAVPAVPDAAAPGDEAQGAGAGVVAEADKLGAAANGGAAGEAAESGGAGLVVLELGPYAIVDAEIGTQTPQTLDDADFLILLDQGENLVILDPQSGEATALNTDLRSVYLVTETHIVGRIDSGVVSIPLAGLETEPIELGFDYHQLDVYEVNEPHQLMTRLWRDNSVITNLHDLGTGDVVETTEVPEGVLVQQLGQTGLANSVGSGVYEETANGFRWFSDGVAFAATAELVLVQQCNARFVCMNLWLDRVSGAPTSNPTLILDERSYWDLRTTPDGRWLFDAAQGFVVAIEIRTGRRVVIDELESWIFGSGAGLGFDLSSDGAWLGFPSNLGQKTTLVNLETETFYNVQTTDRVDGVFLIPRAALG